MQKLRLIVLAFLVLVDIALCQKATKAPATKATKAPSNQNIMEKYQTKQFQCRVLHL